MKVSRLRSLSAKLFYYMSLLVLITVAGNSFQHINTFLTHQTQQVQDNIQLSAERTASQLESTIDAWRSQIAVALPTMRGLDPKSTTEQLQKFVDSSAEFVQLQLFEAPSARSTKLNAIGESFTSAINDTRFEDKVPAKVRSRLKSTTTHWLKKKAPNLQKSPVAIVSAAKAIGLPVMVIAIRFDVTGSTSVVWATLSVWQTNLIKALPKSKFIDSAVVDTRGRIFASPNHFDMVNQRSFSGPALARAALKGATPSGFVNEYRNSRGESRLGAFARLPRYDLAVLVEQDAEVAYQALRRNLLWTGLWAALFIAIAVMFSWLGASSITKGLRAVSHATTRIAGGDFRHRINLKSRDEVGLLGDAVNHMSRRILELMKAQIQKARFEKELETAKIVQSTFFPKEDIHRGPLSVTGAYFPASECGGDLWGHFTIEEGVDFVYIADAMGHGAPAALVTAMAYSTTMTVADIVRERPELRDSPAKILERLNRIIYDAVCGSISMTFFASIIDMRRGIMTYANAGHNFPLIIPADKDDPRAGSRRRSQNAPLIKPISLSLGGHPLGMEREVSYTEKTIELRPGDKILYFTDGLIECTSPKGEVWGRKYLVEQAAELAATNCDQLKDELLQRAFAFFADCPLSDDVTVAVAEISKSWAAPSLSESASKAAAASASYTEAIETSPPPHPDGGNSQSQETGEMVPMTLEATAAEDFADEAPDAPTAETAGDLRDELALQLDPTPESADTAGPASNANMDQPDRTSESSATPQARSLPPQSMPPVSSSGRYKLKLPRGR